MAVLQLFFTLVPLIALMSYIILMLFFSISQKDRLIRSFMLVLCAMILWPASAVFMAIQLYPGVLFWDRVMIVGMISVTFLLYYFVSIFTNSLKIIPTIFWGFVTFSFIVINIFGLIVTDASVITNPVTIWGRQFITIQFQYTLGIMVAPLYIFSSAIIVSTLLKARRSIKNNSPTYGSINLVNYGIVLIFLGALCNVIPALGKYPIDILTCFINAFLLFTAIYKYRMLDLRFVVTKGLAYSLFAILLTVAYIFSVFFIQAHIGNKYNDLTPYFTTLVALGVAVIFQPLYQFTSKLVDKMFYKAEYFHRQALKNFSMSISNNLDLDNIAKDLIEAVQMALNSQQVLVLLKNEEQEHFQVFCTSSPLYQPDLQISFDNPIITWLRNNDTGLSREQIYSQPYFKSMWEQEKIGIYNLGIELIIPIKSRDDIIGLLLLTRRNNNVAYTLADLDLLTYLGASTAVAFDNARLYTRLQSDAITDSLTKLYNHRYFCKALPEQINKIGPAELSLLMIDLDLFKLYNDLYGHFEGDRALEMVASILKRNVGDSGIVCRYGGEEFTVILPFYDSKRAFELTEKIRLEIESIFFNMNDVTQRFLTASAGICTYPHAAPNMEELLKRTDLAMYTAKNQGKNQTVIYSPRVFTSEGSSKHGLDDILVKPSYIATIFALTAAIDAKDHYTFGHSQRVAEYATILASNMSLDNAHIEILREAALLHDIGKLGVPENILTKAGKLSNEEYDIVKKHVEMSITIIKHLPSLNHVIPAVIGHHERWDGKGYPRGLTGENIPFLARCLAITDVFDALTSNRPYRVGLTVNAALHEIKYNLGTQFDPVMGNLFIKLVLDGTIKVDKRGEIKNIS
jgi:diguanylate cyclase (GGDEF)-like protein/putative nucleotidyltransferase with HDIG domain